MSVSLAKVTVTYKGYAGVHYQTDTIGEYAIRYGNVHAESASWYVGRHRYMATFHVSRGYGHHSHAITVFTWNDGGYWSQVDGADTDVATALRPWNAPAGTVLAFATAVADIG